MKLFWYRPEEWGKTKRTKNHALLHFWNIAHFWAWCGALRKKTFLGCLEIDYMKRCFLISIDLSIILNTWTRRLSLKTKPNFTKILPSTGENFVNKVLTPIPWCPQNYLMIRQDHIGPYTTIRDYSLKHPKLFCLYLSNEMSLRGRFVFKTNGRISSITSYKDHCCSFFTSWVIKEQKTCNLKIWKNTQLWAWGVHLRRRQKVET